jgi:CBS domain-containing protein
MQVSEVMHKGVISVNIDDTIKKVAQIMRREDIGALPVLEDNKAVGIVTDRDIIITCVAEGNSASDPVSSAMSEDVISVNENDEVEVASKLMQENQISRILVLDEEQRPVGMLTLRDLASNSEDHELNSHTLAKIKE